MPAPARFPLSDPPAFYLPLGVAGVFRDEGLFVLGVVGLVLSMAVALTVAGPWLSWWRFVRGRPETPGEVTRARFEMLCDRSRVSGTGGVPCWQDRCSAGRRPLRSRCRVGCRWWSSRCGPTPRHITILT